MEKIDFVVAFVDGGDREWLKKKAKYSSDLNVEDMAMRYRDWDNFKYWFRSVEKYAPWVNNIYVVTDRQTPAFLNLDNPKIHLVFHDEYIPEKYLPTFCANPIENNLFRIKGLENQFVFFNDDTFLNRPLKPTDFFRKGKPCYSLIERPYSPKMPIETHNYFALTCMAMINKHFTRKDVIKHFFHFFNLKYGKAAFGNLLMLPYKSLQHFQDNHMPCPYLKSTYEEVWEKEAEYMDKISYNKFRSHLDVNQYVFRYWDLARGNFAPYSMKTGYYSVNKNTVNLCADDIKNSKSFMVCVNDGGDNENFESNKKIIKDTFEHKFPEKCSFEK